MVFFCWITVGLIGRTICRSDGYSAVAREKGRCRTALIRLFPSPVAVVSRTGHRQISGEEGVLFPSRINSCLHGRKSSTAAEDQECAAAKDAVRKAFLARRRRLRPAEVSAASERICRRLQELPEFLSCPTVALYRAFDNEVSLNNLIAKCGQLGKRVLLPRFNRTAGEYEMVEIKNVDRDTVPGYYGISEPRPELKARGGSSLQSRDMVWLVPGVAFDSGGRRVGRGAGFYDRLLSGVSGIVIGVAYDWQIVSELPRRKHDRAMNIVVSEVQVVRVRQSTAEA